MSKPVSISRWAAEVLASAVGERSAKEVNHAQAEVRLALGKGK